MNLDAHTNCVPSECRVVLLGTHQLTCDTKYPTRVLVEYVENDVVGRVSPRTQCIYLCSHT